MLDVSSPPRRSATPVAGSNNAAVKPPKAAMAIEFDSSAADLISSHAERIRGLASCGVCLTTVEAAGGRFEGEELASNALPALNYVIMDMADQIAEAGERLWEQYRQAAAVANGQEMKS